jgi:homoserine kinase
LGAVFFFVWLVSGHPDNVAPAIYGGIQLGIHTGERWMTERVNTPPGIQVDISM